MTDKRKHLTVLRERWMGCRMCDISKARQSRKIAFGMGNINARILFITDSPSVHDVEIGGAVQDPFKRPLMEEFLKLANIPKSAVFTTSMLGCHPYYVIPATDDTQEQSMPRPPSTSEIESCFSRVTELVYTLDPEIIVAMGENAWKKLVPPKDRTKCKTFRASLGRLWVARIHGRTREVTYPLLTAPSMDRIDSDPSSSDHGPPATLFKILTNPWENIELQKQLYERSKEATGVSAHPSSYRQPSQTFTTPNTASRSSCRPTRS
jgi:uracil-DNA glycosylase family 4